MAGKDAYRFCETLLERVRPIDKRAEIASVSRRDYDDATLVRVRTSAEGSNGVLSALRKMLPLARVSLVQNVMNGHTEAQVLLPSADEQREIAHAMAHQSTGQFCLRIVLRALIVALVGACMARVLR